MFDLNFFLNKYRGIVYFDVKRISCALKQFKTIISHHYENFYFTNTRATFLNLLFL